MAKCAYCDTTILLGGTKDGARRYCNAECQQKGVLASFAEQLPAEEVDRYVHSIHQGLCPACAGPGPVDLHISYRVWSALVLTSWSSRTAVVCQPCGTKRKVKDAAFSAVFGWWGFPWGLLITPIQIGRNFAGMASKVDPSAPSAWLHNVLRLNLANEFAKSSQAQ